MGVDGEAAALRSRARNMFADADQASQIGCLSPVPSVGNAGGGGRAGNKIKSTRSAPLHLDSPFSKRVERAERSGEEWGMLCRILAADGWTDPGTAFNDHGQSLVGHRVCGPPPTALRAQAPLSSQGQCFLVRIRFAITTRRRGCRPTRCIHAKNNRQANVVYARIF